MRELHYAGSHGFDIGGPDAKMEHPGAQAALPDLDQAEAALRRKLCKIPGAQLERKRFAIAAHYRNVAPKDAPRVESALDQVHGNHPRLRKRGGKKVFELLPGITWDKGKAVLWLMDRFGLVGTDVLPIYLGDDLTDEDAFRALKGRGVGIRVGADQEETHADFLLRDTKQVQRFLEMLADRLPPPNATT